jgi:hypothetical protein
MDQSADAKRRVVAASSEDEYDSANHLTGDPQGPYVQDMRLLLPGTEAALIAGPEARCGTALHRSFGGEMPSVACRRTARLCNYTPLRQIPTSQRVESIQEAGRSRQGQKRRISIIPGSAKQKLNGSTGTLAENDWGATLASQYSNF